MKDVYTREVRSTRETRKCGSDLVDLPGTVLESRKTVAQLRLGLRVNPKGGRCSRGLEGRHRWEAS